jgi:chorismate lyase / 3-hydroxybenzoate synthase
MDALPLPPLQGSPVIEQLIDPADAARHAYGALFHALEDSSRPHPLRPWNHLPRISALGGGLALRFLAGTVAPRPLENPRQVPAWRCSRRFGPRSPTFSRAALALLGDGRVALWVSGMAPGGQA